MEGKGKILNTAFAVSGAFVFGDHLAFTAEVNPDMVIPLGGISAVTLSLFLLRPFLEGKEMQRLQVSPLVPKIVSNS